MPPGAAWAASNTSACSSVGAIVTRVRFGLRPPPLPAAAFGGDGGGGGGAATAAPSSSSRHSEPERDLVMAQCDTQ